ncbi:MAG TPA: hypothetical protein VNJ01_10475 [Bacteriovoracaceae bacterium]|nr:hypothetical protein [Bacteriovoracaceae bacterium]
MKKLIALSTFLICASTIADTKTYTEEDFLKKVNVEVKKQVDVIKHKSVSDLTKELIDKETSLKFKESELQKQQDALKISGNELGKKYAAFEAKQKAFIGCLEVNEEESKSRVTQLVDLITNMKPQKAAEVLSVQDADVAVKILQQIDAKKASKIFNFMDKEVSAKIQKQYLLMKK